MFKEHQMNYLIHKHLDCKSHYRNWNIQIGACILAPYYQLLLSAMLSFGWKWTTTFSLRWILKGPGQNFGEGIVVSGASRDSGTGIIFIHCLLVNTNYSKLNTKRIIWLLSLQNMETCWKQIKCAFCIIAAIILWNYLKDIPGASVSDERCNANCMVY